ncbi:MAG: hypothetical protein RLZZ306_1935 [Bacteroidota bacterium]|jgi:hypothetical protein
MAKLKDTNDSIGVTNFIQKLEPKLAEIVEEIRQIILGTDKIIDEQIKWNSPSFFYAGEMKPFDPKEYKRDLAVLNIRKELMLVFPTGASIEDTTGILEGAYTDGRRLVYFKDLEDVKIKKESLQQVIKSWIELVGKE